MKYTKEQLGEMSDKWLAGLIVVRTTELAELKWEARRRKLAVKTPRQAELAELPCTLQDLETAIHSYGDHHGFYGTAGVLSDAGRTVLCVTEGEEACVGVSVAPKGGADSGEPQGWGQVQ